MQSAVMLATFGAASIAMTSAIFGVGLARLLWADDLKFAREIDTIRSKTEANLRSIIDSQRRRIEIMEDAKPQGPKDSETLK